MAVYIGAAPSRSVCQRVLPSSSDFISRFSGVLWHAASSNDVKAVSEDVRSLFYGVS